MARCHLVIGLCVLHICFALSYGPYYEPRLIPRAPEEYYQPQPQPQPNPYTQYYAPNPPLGYEPEYGYQEDPQNEFLEVQAGSTGGVSPATSTAPAVQTPQQTTPAPQSTGTTSTPTPTSTMDALDIQLAAALEAVKADMISKGKEILEEKQWTDDVKTVITTYQKKITNVYANIETLKVAMGSLYRKKQQIINAQIQKSLTAKLKDSKSDLQTVQAALDKVTNTQMEFEQSKKDIQSTIDSIFAQLAELKGQPAPSPTASTTGTSSTTSATNNANSQSPSSSDSSSTDSTDASSFQQDIVDKKAEISSKIDTIKSIVDALNVGSPSR